MLQNPSPEASACVILRLAMNEQIALQNTLRKRFEELRAKNPSYSIRAFARRVGVNSGALSAILSGKRNASVKIAERVAERLMLDPQERHELLSKFPKRRLPSRAREAGVTTGEVIDSQYLKLNAAQFKVIADWEHLAVLSLMETKDFESGVTWMANRLGVTETRMRTVIDNLLALNLVALNDVGKLIRTQERVRSPDDQGRDLSINRNHEQALEQARASLFRDSTEDRDLTSITMAIDVKKLSMAKELIRKFQDELSDLVETGDRTEVYRLSMQMIPVTNLRKQGNGK